MIETYKPKTEEKDPEYNSQVFDSSRSDEAWENLILKEEEKRRAKEGNKNDESLLGDDITLVGAEDDEQKQEDVTAVEFESGGNISEEDAAEFERNVKYIKAGGDPDKFSADGNVAEMINDGESMRAELKKQQKNLEEKGATDGQDYKNILEKLSFIEHKLKDLHDTEQGEEMESLIERQQKVEKQQDVPNEKLDEQGEATKAYLQREGAWEENQESQGRRVEVVEENPVVETNTETNTEPELESVVMDSENEERQEEMTVEQLHENAELSHQAFVEAQRRFSRAKGKFGLVGKVRQKLGIAGTEKKEELNQSKEEFEQAKKGLKDAEEKFRDEYKEYTKYLVDQKKAEMIAQDQSRREVNNWSDEEAVKRKDKYKKLPEFKETLRLFVVSEKVIDSKQQEIGADGEMRETVEKLSLLEDMNKKLMAVNKAKIEALSESDKSILQKTWNWYRRQPKSKKIWYGVACAAPLAAGAALAGGATVGAVLGAAAFGGVTKGASSFVSMGVGGFVYKKSKKWHQARQGLVEEKKEEKMVKEVSKDKDIDLYDFMKDRLAQEKKDNYKSLAAAGIAGFAVGGGMRGIWSQEGLAGLEGQPDVAETDIDTIENPEGVSLTEAAPGAVVEAQLNQGIRDTFNAKAAELEGVDQFENKFQTWKQVRQELIENGHEDTRAFQELDKTFGKEAYANYQKLHHEIDPKDVEHLESDGGIDEFEPRESNENPKANELESEAANQVVVQKLSASEFKEGIENMRKGGRMPNLQQMRDYKHAIRAEETGVEFFPKSQLPDDVVEKLVSTREVETPTEVELSEQELEELADNEPKDRMTQEEYMAEKKEIDESEALTGNEPKDRMTQEEYMIQQELTKDKIASDGAGEEFGAGYDPELRDLEDDSKTDLETESIPDLKEFNFDLAKDDILWAKLSENMGGNELKVAETLNEFRKESAKSLIGEYGFSPKDAQNYVKWRFQNLQPGDTISFGDEKLNIANFVDKGNTDFFVSKFNVRTTIDEDIIAGLDPENKFEDAA